MTILGTDTKRRIGHLADKYRLRMIHYRTILQGLFPERPVECYLVFVDEPDQPAFKCITQFGVENEESRVEA